MTTEIICAIIAVIGTLVSAYISYFVSQATANKELEKLRLTWEREDVVSSDDEFALMTAAVGEFLSYYGWREQKMAMGKVAAIRSKEAGELGEALDELYETISSRSSSTNDALSKVIEKKREAKSRAKAACHSNPNN